jgi:hypothetical protein
MDNIIQFPKKSKKQFVKEEINEELMKSNILDIKLTHINEALVVILPQLFSNIDMVGASATDIDLDEIDDAKEINLIAESIRAILYKYYNISHPFQKLAENLFEIDENDNIRISRKIEIDFSDEYGENINI